MRRPRLSKPRFRGSSECLLDAQRMRGSTNTSSTRELPVSAVNRSAAWAVPPESSAKGDRAGEHRQRGLPCAAQRDGAER